MHPQLFWLNSVLAVVMSKWFAKAAWEGETSAGAGGESSAGSTAASHVDDSYEADDALDDLEGEPAGDELANLLLELHYSGRMSAKTVCLIAWYASRAGALGSIKHLALRPSASSGHFQRKLDRSQGINLRDHRFYLVTTPGRRKWDVSRAVYQTPMRLPHEVIHRELQDDPSILPRLTHAIESRQFPPSYFDHVVVRESPSPVLPLVLYMDGVKVHNRSNLFQISLYNVITERRHLLVALRKEHLCRCSCRGRCTMHAMFATIKWSLERLAEGMWPSSRHDGRAWLAPFDNVRKLHSCKDRRSWVHTMDQRGLGRIHPFPRLRKLEYHGQPLSILQVHRGEYVHS